MTSRPEDITILGPEYTQNPWKHYYVVDDNDCGCPECHPLMHEADTKEQAETIAQKVRDRIDEYNEWRDDGEGAEFIEEKIL